MESPRGGFKGFQSIFSFSDGAFAPLFMLSDDLFFQFYAPRKERTYMAVMIEDLASCSNMNVT